MSISASSKPSTASHAERTSDATSAATSRAQNLAQGILCFSLSSRTYGLDVSLVREVVTVPRVVPVPRVAQPIVGVFTLRGATVALVDGEILFGISQGGNRAKALIITRGHRVLCGFSIDDVLGVIPFEPAQFTAAIPGQDPRQVAGFVTHKQMGLLTVLDAATIINSIEQLRG
jgi:chemotaxis signal transduction protein